MLIRPWNVVFTLIIFVCVLQVLVNPFRLLGVYNMAPVVLVCIYSVGLLAFIFYFNFFFRGLGLFEIALISLLIMNLIYAITIENDLSKIITGVIRPVFFFSIVMIFSTIRNRDTVNILPTKVGVNALFWAYVIGVSIVAFIYLVIGGIRASASAIPLALPFFYFFFNRKYGWAAVCLLLFVLGGKFGPFAGVLAALFLVMISSLKRATGLALFIFVLLVFTYLATGGELLSVLRVPVLAKLHLPALFTGELDLYKLDTLVFGGRLSEAYSSVLGINFESSPILSWLFGGGVGYTYDWMNFLGDVFLKDNSGVHFTPVAVFVTYGFPFLVLLLIYLLKYLYLSCLILINSSNYESANVVWAAFFVTSIVNMLTAYSLFTNLLLAVSIGLLKQIKIQKYH